MGVASILMLLAVQLALHVPGANAQPAFGGTTALPGLPLIASGLPAGGAGMQVIRVGSSPVMAGYSDTTSTHYGCDQSIAEALKEVDDLSVLRVVLDAVGLFDILRTRSLALTLLAPDNLVNPFAARPHSYHR